MKRPGVLVLLASVASGATAAAMAWQRARRNVAAQLQALDDDFHTVYGRLRLQAAYETPVLVHSGELLTLFLQDRKQEYTITHRWIELLKATAHVPVGLFALLHSEPSVRVIAQQLTALETSMQESELALADLDTETRTAVANVLGATHALVAHVLAEGRVDPDDIALFAGEQGPALLQLIERATELELAALHEATEAALGTLTASQRAELEVVVAGVHQARARSLALQYFQKRFGEQPGEEKRVSYAEAAADVEEARQLVGTRKLDRAIAGAFFGDERRLQRDVLADAAAKLLARSDSPGVGVS